MVKVGDVDVNTALRREASIEPTDPKPSTEATSVGQSIEAEAAYKQEGIAEVSLKSDRPRPVSYIEVHLQVKASSDFVLTQ